MDRRPIAKTLPGDDLAPWEEQYARWMAMQTTRVDGDAEQAAVAMLVGHNLTPTALKVTKRKLAWKRVYQNARAEVAEMQLARARTRAMSIAPKAMSVYKKAVDKLDEEFDRVDARIQMGDEEANHMKALRVAPHLLNPFLDRVAPKRTEKSESGPRVVINLTAAQSRALDAPVMTVESEEQPVAVIPATTGE